MIYDDGSEIMCFYNKPEEGKTVVDMNGVVLGQGNNIMVIAESKSGRFLEKI